MKRLLVASIKMLYRDRQALFYALIFPVIFVTVFGLFDLDRPPEINVAVVADRASPVADAIADGLGEVESVAVARSSNLTKIRGDLADGEFDVVLVVPAASGPARVTAYYDQANFDVNQLALSAVERIVDRMNLEMSGISTPPLTVEAEPVEARTADYYDFLLPGLVAMGVMNFSIMGMSIAIARFREQRILRRILATPLPPGRFVTAQVAARLLLSLIQTGLILAVGVFVFGGRVRGNVLWLFVLAALANLIFLNFAFAVAGRASNPDAAAGIGNSIAVPMMFLSGVFFPTDTLPVGVRDAVQYLPLTPLIDAMRTVAVQGKSITATGSELLLLGAWIAASLLIARRYFRFADT